MILMDFTSMKKATMSIMVTMTTEATIILERATRMSLKICSKATTLMIMKMILLHNLSEVTEMMKIMLIQFRKSIIESLKSTQNILMN
jgi:hypothetical protein